MPQDRRFDLLTSELCRLAARCDRDRVGSCRTVRLRSNNLHFRPIVRKFLATIQTDDIGSGDYRRYGTPRFSFHRDGKAATLMRTTEDEIEQTHRPPLTPSAKIYGFRFEGVYDLTRMSVIAWRHHTALTHEANMYIGPVQPQLAANPNGRNE